MESNRKAILKVGIISDSQCNEDANDWGFYNLELAFKQLARQGIDVLLEGGDLSEMGFPQVYPVYRKLFDRCFADKRPVELHCIGNHDYGWDADTSWVPRRYGYFCDGLGQTRENPALKTVAGYDFIALHADVDKLDYSAESLSRLDALLAVRTAANPGKPVFIITHEPPAHTVTGSYSSTRQPGLRAVMDKYPQVVSFSSHCHIPLQDERNIWQGEFTAMATSTLSYGCIEDDVVNLCGPILPFAREVIQMMVMEIYDDELVIRRFAVLDDREIKPDNPWRIKLPYRPAEAFYIQDRPRPAKPPVFPADSRLLTRYDYGYYYVIFPRAIHDDFTHFYDIAVETLDESGACVSRKSGRFIATFYRRECHLKDSEVYKLPGEWLTAGTMNRISVYPVETFGAKGEPLVTMLNIPAGRTCRSAQAAYPQE